MTLHAGFADPVLDAQACFRAVLDAMAHPGRIVVADAPDPPTPLDPATAAVLLTLVDAETPLWLDDALAPAGSWIGFHCGAALVARDKAAFGLAMGGPEPAGTTLAGFRTGTDDAPEDGATVILQVAALGRGRALRLSGPGLAAPAVLWVDGLAAGFVAEWAANHAGFPRGVDLILCAGRHLAALPRSVRVEEG